MEQHNFDILIIGGSKEGLQAYNELNKYNKAVGLVTKELTDPLFSGTYFKKEIIFIKYSLGLFFCYTANNSDIFVTPKLIIATGLKPAKLLVNNNIVEECLYSEPKSYPRNVSEQKAVVLGNNYIAAQLALQLSKNYKQVYFCSDHMQLDFVKRLATRVAHKDNISVFFGCNPVEVQNKIIHFDNFMKLEYDTIFAITDRTPDIDIIPKNMIEISNSGYIKTTSNCESTKMPGLFIIGKINYEFNKTIFNQMIKELVK